MHYFFSLAGGDHRFSNKELLVTKTELAVMARPASAGYRRPRPAISINVVLYANA
jgi:hypothetical protein